MARQPTLAPETALIQCEATCGPRGSAVVTSENRAFVRRWLVANDVPSFYVQTLSLKTLEGVWNDATDQSLQACRIMGQNKIKQGYKPAPDSQDTDENDADNQDTDDDSPQPIEQPTDIPPPPNPRKHNGQSDADKAAKALSDALGLFASLNKQQTPDLDEARVIRLIQTHAPKPEIPIYKTEIKLPDRPVITSDAEPRHEIFPELLGAIAAGLNVLLVGPAGCGKTHIARQVATALGFDFRFTGAIGSEYKLLGYTDAHGRLVETEYRRAYMLGAVFLFDEMDGSAPGALLSFNAGLANGHQDFPDMVVARHPNFRAIAACNTYGHGADRQYVGRNQLDAASLDRFYVIPMDYDQKLERTLFGDNEWVSFVHKVRAAVRNLSIRHVVSMRAINDGQAALAAGIARKDVERAVIWKHLKPEDISKVRAAI